MKNVRFALRLTIGLLLLLAVATALQPAPRSKAIYARALRNFDVSAASASCLLGQKCVGNIFRGHCTNGDDPNVGCVPDLDGNGCYWCAI